MEKIIIVTSQCNNAEIVEQILRNEGFGNIEIIGSGGEMRRKMRNGEKADLIIINTPLSDEFGNDLAEDIANEFFSVIMLCSVSVATELERKFDELKINIIAKPIDSVKLISCLNNIETLNKNQWEIKESSEILCRIGDIRFINHAKSVLMKNLKFTEPQAHRYLEKQAMNNRCTRREVAMRIINMYEK